VVALRGRGSARRVGGAARMRRFFDRAFAIVALAAVINLAFAPVLRAAIMARAPSSVSEVAADLKATFGDAFELCVNLRDDGSTPAPSHQGDDGCCPLCCLHAAAHLLAPEFKALPLRLAVRRVELPPSEDVALPPPSRASPSQPRAPPLS
jgi:Protein of unknown function (DUF2946)